MEWEKKGFVYGPKGNSWWAKHSAITPTPILISEDIIRVYAGFRDDNGVSRIGYVDVNAHNPAEINAVSKEPVLDIGIPGTFDDNGVILGDVIAYGQKFYMYYIGFQLVEKVKFLAYTGLAISEDGGHSFKRFSHAPILDRAENELFFRAIHSVIIEDGVWKAWCGVGSEWVWIDGNPYPKYNIRYYESTDGVHFSSQGKLCIDFKDNEYRIGRPRVIKKDDIYQMFYTRGTLSKDYVPGYAESRDGIHWTRKDSEIGISLSTAGWDSIHLAYPAIIDTKEKVYMFYNGNHFGKEGFGYAILNNK